MKTTIELGNYSAVSADLDSIKIEDRVISFDTVDKDGRKVGHITSSLPFKVETK